MKSRRHEKQETRSTKTFFSGFFDNKAFAGDGSITQVGNEHIDLSIDVDPNQENMTKYSLDTAYSCGDAFNDALEKRYAQAINDGGIRAKPEATLDEMTLESWR